MEKVIKRMRQQLENVTNQIEDLREEKVGSQQGFSNFQNIVKDLEK